MIRIDVAERLHSGAVGGLEDEQASDRCFTIVFDEGPCRDNLNPVRRGPVEVGAMGAIMLGPRLQALFSVKGMDNEKHSRPLEVCSSRYLIPVAYFSIRHPGDRRSLTLAKAVSTGPSAAALEKLEHARGRSVLRLIGNGTIPILGPGEALL
jgi:hypothetical protein